MVGGRWAASTRRCLSFQATLCSHLAPPRASGPGASVLSALEPVIAGSMEAFADGYVSESGSTLPGQAQSVSSSSMSSTCSSPASRVDFPSQKHRRLECKLCTCTAGSGSPFSTAGQEEHEKYGRYRPWAKYVPGTMDNGEAVRVPAGKMCLLCLNCYRQLGYHIKYGSISKYMQLMQTNPAEHQAAFHRSLKVYIKKLQENPDSIRLRHRRDLLNAQVTLDDVQKKGIKRSTTYTFIERVLGRENQRPPA